MYRAIHMLLLVVSFAHFASAEFYSDVDSAEQDQKKALEVKAQDFWNGLMQSAEYLETTENAKLSAKVDRALAKLSAEHNDIRELFHKSMGHLAKADSMLFDEAIKFKELARERLDHGPSSEAFLELSGFENVFYAAYKRFVGGKSTYQERLARHIISRLKDIKPQIHNIPEMAPQMLEESSKASDKAYEITHSRDDGSKGDLPLHLRKLAYEIVSATGKQRLRFTNYMLNSFMTAAEDIASKEEAPSKTLVRRSLRGLESGMSEHAPDSLDNVIAIQTAPSQEEGTSLSKEVQASEGDSVSSDMSSDCLFFHDGIPIDAKPITDYMSGMEHMANEVMSG
jgi:hypothetical protein